MSITVTTDVLCDGIGCSQWIHGVTGPRTDARSARNNARRDGWSVTSRGDLCPDCRPKKVRSK